MLELPPFDRCDSKTQVRRVTLRETDKFSQALTELEQQLYRESV